MNDKFRQLLGVVKKLNLPDGEYAIFGSGPMAVRGIKPTDDLDVMVASELYKKLKEIYSEKQKQGYKEIVYYLEPIQGIEVIKANISGFNNPESVISRAELIEGLRFVLLKDIIAWKKKMARPKDFEHIKMIEDYLCSIKQ